MKIEPLVYFTYVIFFIHFFFKKVPGKMQSLLRSSSWICTKSNIWGVTNPCTTTSPVQRTQKTSELSSKQSKTPSSEKTWLSTTWVRGLGLVWFQICIWCNFTSDLQFWYRHLSNCGLELYAFFTITKPGITVIAPTEAHQNCFNIIISKR